MPMYSLYMTRRDVTKLAAAAAFAPQRAVLAEDAKYTGALDGYLDKVNGAGFDPVAFSKRLYETAPMKLAFQARNRQEAETWQRNLRAKVAELVGPMPAKRVALESQTLEIRDYPGYRREKFVFQTRPDAWVLGYLLTPKAGRTPHAAVVCLPGHGRGVDDIVGIDEQGKDRTMKVGYAYDYGVQVAEHGMAAVAIEMMAFGCRRDPINKQKGLTANSCQPTAGAALLLGQTMVAWRV